ncbi:MAG: DUF4129 domain-containing protein, partial [Deltaproteobacteria bacterium]|nr:DUF4129 domain-containing protein [Deltaproteobacteria bacterium]
VTARRSRKRPPVSTTYDQVSKLLAKAGFAREAAETPLERARRMRARSAIAAAEVGELTDLYYAAEWGGQRDATAEVRATALAHEIKRALRAAR